ncbi:MAG TPA: hypothetical protein VNQ78_05575 [Paracoccus sp. (in: a-proteobacteria)]|uniref:hypothetical protein n=1 Tax=Paracoccus sp. TaxID=267 RepID=UPI002B822CFB|nr:hypothetical protein [Paracoccus sp. (in: a-proteobacteria)]HWL56129.1 hypothetical protein [Paracoccus sp. (in: a-proteobacteria)]
MRRDRLFIRSFWGAILMMAALVIGLSAVALLRDHPVLARILPPPAPSLHEIPETRLGQMIREAGEAAYRSQAARLDDLLASAYAPVYAGIPAYADFHYSLLGEYSELGAAALGRMGEAMEGRLFPGLAHRLEGVAADLDQGFLDIFSQTLDRQIGAELAALERPAVLGEVTRGIEDDAIARVRVTAPVAAAMTLAAPPAIKAASALMAKKLATKIAGKAAAKGAVKATGIGGGAAGGAAICAPGGPIASIICGAGAAAVIWFGTDAAIVNLDEYFNREEFEAELRAMIDENREAVRAEFLAALNAGLMARVSRPPAPGQPREASGVAGSFRDQARP